MPSNIESLMSDLPDHVCPRCFGAMRLVPFWYRTNGRMYECNWPCEDAKRKAEQEDNRRKYQGATDAS